MEGIDKFMAPKNKPETGRVVREDQKRLRAMRFLEEKLQGKSLNEIAQNNNVSRFTVERALSWGERAGLFATFQDKLLGELVPAAHSAILDALLDGDATVALEVFKAAQIYQQKQPQGTADKGDDLLLYVNRLRSEQQNIEEIKRGTVEGEVINERPAISTTSGSIRSIESSASQKSLPAVESSFDYAQLIHQAKATTATGSESGSENQLDQPSKSTSERPTNNKIEQRVGEEVI